MLWHSIAPPTSTFANFYGDTVTVYSPGGVSLVRTVSQRVHLPGASALDDHDNLYVTHSGAAYQPAR